MTKRKKLIKSIKKMDIFYSGASFEGHSYKQLLVLQMQLEAELSKKLKHESKETKNTMKKI